MNTPAAALDTRPVALITGATGGLGLALVRHLVRQGWHVFAADCNPGGLDALRSESNITPLMMDVTQTASIEAARSLVQQQTAYLDAIVNFAGILRVVGEAASQEQAVDFEVVITLDQPPSTLRPDLSATADVVTATRLKAIAVPIIAVTVRDPDGKKFKVDDSDKNPNAIVNDDKVTKTAEVEGVFLMKDGKAHFVPVKIGIAGERYFEVQSGLKGGEAVVAGPYAAIRDLEEGTEIHVAPVPKGDAKADSAARGAK